MTMNFLNRGVLSLEFLFALLGTVRLVGRGGIDDSGAGSSCSASGRSARCSSPSSPPTSPRRRSRGTARSTWSWRYRLPRRRVRCARPISLACAETRRSQAIRRFALPIAVSRSDLLPGRPAAFFGPSRCAITAGSSRGCSSVRCSSGSPRYRSTCSGIEPETRDSDGRCLRHRSAEHSRTAYRPAAGPFTSMPTLDVDGVGLYYEEKGNGEPVVFSHGIPTDHRAWNFADRVLLQELQDHLVQQAIRVAQRRNGDLSDSTIANNAADLKGFIEKLGARKGPPGGPFVRRFHRGLSGLRPSGAHPLPRPGRARDRDPARRGRDEFGPDACRLLFGARRSPCPPDGSRTAPCVRRSQRSTRARPRERSSSTSTESRTSRGSFKAMPDASEGDDDRQRKDDSRAENEAPPFQGAGTEDLIQDAGRQRGGTALFGCAASASLRRPRYRKSAARAIANARHFPHMENPPEFNQQVLAFISGTRASGRQPLPSLSNRGPARGGLEGCPKRPRAPISCSRSWWTR